MPSPMSARLKGMISLPSVAAAARVPLIARDPTRADRPMNPVGFVLLQEVRRAWRPVLTAAAATAAAEWV